MLVMREFVTGVSAQGSERKVRSFRVGGYAM